MIKKMFRSRGFRYENETGLLKMKIYYDADSSVIEGNELLGTIDKKMQLFEYSVDEYGNVETVNFHNDFTNIINDGFGENMEEIHNRIIEIFDDSFRDYTIGYRIKENEVIGKSVYYYPTAWKGTRYGIKGITDKAKMSIQLNRFIDTIDVNTEDKIEILQFTSLFYKFKGCGITFSHNGNKEYKLYGRILSKDINDFFQNKVNLSACNIYGDVVLTAIRIRNGVVSGYNLYYLF